jgi:hypothetical protein
MGRGFSFRLLYRVVFFSFCLIFACFYHGGGSGCGRRDDKTEPNKSKDEFKGKPVSASITKIEISFFDDENFLIFPDFFPGFPDISLNF